MTNDEKGIAFVLTLLLVLIVYLVVVFLRSWWRPEDSPDNPQER